MTVILLGLVLAACTAAGDGAPTEPPATTLPDGAADGGDLAAPGLGNGGYRVEHYDLDLTVGPDLVELSATARVDVRVDERIGSLSLDLRGLDVTAVRVDGEPVEAVRRSDELRVPAPGSSFPTGQIVEIAVDYGGGAVRRAGATGASPVGWTRRGWGAVVVPGPGAASTWFPGNDTPADPASVALTLTAPSTVAALGPGRLVDRRVDGAATTWRWVTGRDVPPDEAGVVLVEDAVTRTVDGAGVDIRVVASPALIDAAVAEAEVVPAAVEVFADALGPSPVAAFGLAVVDEAVAAPLTGAGWVVVGADVADGQGGASAFVAQAVAAQWFGVAVPPATVGDRWAGVGRATWMTWHLLEVLDGRPTAEVADFVREGLDADAPAPVDPPPGRMDDPAVAVRGALAVQALRERLDPEAFARVLRGWARVRGQAVTTADVVAQAEASGGEEAGAVLVDWLTGPRPDG